MPINLESKIQNCLFNIFITNKKIPIVILHQITILLFRPIMIINPKRNVLAYSRKNLIIKCNVPFEFVMGPPS